MFDVVSVWAMTLGMIALVAICVQVGIAVGNRIARGLGKEERSSEGAGTVVGALLGLLAFMLAFTFSMAAERRETRKQLLLDEVNSIGTTFLRTGMIPEPQRRHSRSLLRKYVDLRLELANDSTKLANVIEKSTAIQQALWRDAESLAEADLKNPDIAALYVDSLNETIDLQTSRLAVGGYRIPSVVWIMFGTLVALASFAVGYGLGLQTNKRHRLLTGLLAVSFASVTFLILDLDHGNNGWLKVDQQPMFNLREQLGEDSGT
jgi:hypothetical protein